MKRRTVFCQSYLRTSLTALANSFFPLPFVIPCERFSRCTCTEKDGHGLWQLISIALQEWDDRRWSHAKASTAFPREKCRGWCLSPAPFKRETADFAHGTKTHFVPVSKGTVINALQLCPNVSPRTRAVPPRFLSYISVFSQV